MPRTIRFALLAILVLCFAVPASAQWTLFVVEPGGSGTTYPTLAAALATAAPYPNGPHKIMVKAGTYTTDVNLTVSNVDEIYGDPTADVGDVVFSHAGGTFMNLADGLTVRHMTVDGYAIGFDGKAAAVVNSSVLDDLVITNGGDGVKLNNANAEVMGSKIFNNTGYAIRKLGTTHTWTKVHDNCFYGNAAGTSECYNDVALALPPNGGASDNYYGDDNPVWNGSAGTTDASQWLADNSASGPGTVDVGATNVEYSFDWTLPSCSDVIMLAAYEFTVSWDPTKLELVPGSAAYNPDFFGAEALYTDPIVGTNTITFAAADFNEPGAEDGQLALARFNAIGTGTSQITIASYYRDENNNDISVSNTPLDVDVQDNEPPTITLTASNEVDNVYSDGGPGSDPNVPHVLLYVEGTVHDNYELKDIWYRIDGGGWNPIKTCAPGLQDDSYGDISSLAFYINTSTLAEGVGHNLEVAVNDMAGNPYGSFIYPFQCDRTPPAAPTVALADPTCPVDPTKTNDQTVTVTLTGGVVGDDWMQVYDNGDSPPHWQDSKPYAASESYTLLPSVGITEGSKAIAYRLIDKYGNVGSFTYGNIYFDPNAPVIGGTLTLANGAAKTKDLLIALGGVTGIGVNDTWKAAASIDDLDCDDAGWLPYGGWQYTLTKSSGETEDVYFAVRDEAGNVSNVLTNSIVIDQDAPAAPAVEVFDPSGDGVGGSDCTDTYAVNVEVTYTDGDVAVIYIDDGGAVSSYAATGSPQLCAYTMTGGYPSGTDVTINVKLEDDAKGGLTGAPPGNVGDAGHFTIHLDYSNATLASMVIVDKDATAAPLGNPDWSNSTTVNLSLSGLSADATDLIISEDNWTTADTFSIGPGPYSDPFVYEYTYQGTPTECAPSGIWVMAMDCAGNKSGASADNIWFDLTLPVFDAFTGPTYTTGLLVSGLALTATETCNMWQMQLSEASDFSGATWVTFSASTSFTLAPGSDGPRIIWARIADAAGNIAADVRSITVNLDTGPPTGSFVVRQDPVANPFATQGPPDWYTNSLTTNEIISISPSETIQNIKIRNVGGTVVTVGSAVTSYAPWSLEAGVDGTRTVQMKFQDLAGNWTPDWTTVQASIILDRAKPAKVSSATGTPTGSIEMSWTAGPQDKSYILRYNFSGEYPHFTSGPPPAPATQLEGIPIAEGNAWTGTDYTFEAPQTDLYHFSIWARDSAGNVSNLPNTDVLCTDYILGDWMTSDKTTAGPDGCIDKLDDFYAGIGAFYNISSPDPLYVPFADVGPTNKTTYPFDYPTPDGLLGFEDLIIVASNYAHHRCGMLRGADGTKPKVAPPAPVAMTVEVPAWVAKGNVVSIPVFLENTAPILGYHVVLNYNADNFDLVSVQRGGAFSNANESFFYYDPEASNIDVTACGLGEDLNFVDGEQFIVTLRATRNADLSVEPLSLIFRDVVNADINVEFNQVVTAASAPLPTSYSLLQNYPNPFNAGTVIQFNAPVATDYTITIYNIVGQSVQTFAGHTEAGQVTIRWDAADYSSGIYLYRVQADTYTATKKMVLLK